MFGGDHKVSMMSVTKVPITTSPKNPLKAVTLKDMLTMMMNYLI